MSTVYFIQWAGWVPIGQRLGLARKLPGHLGLLVYHAGMPGSEVVEAKFAAIAP
jgi:hypothetical protein